jgi:hypothetical protein
MPTVDTFQSLNDAADEEPLDAGVARLAARYQAALDADKNADLASLAYAKDPCVRQEVEDAIKRVRRQNRAVGKQSRTAPEPVTATRLAIDLGFGTVPKPEAVAFVQQQLRAHESSRAKAGAKRVLVRLNAYGRLATQNGCAAGARGFARPCLTQSNVRRMVGGKHVALPDSYRTDELQRRLIVKRTPLSGNAWHTLHAAAETLLRRWIASGVQTALCTRGRANLVPGDLPLNGLEERLPGWTIAAPAEGMLAHARQCGVIGEPEANQLSLKAWAKVVSANRSLVASNP